MLCDKLNSNNKLLTFNATEHLERVHSSSLTVVDLWVLIFKKIPSSQSLTLREVCKYWHTIFFKVPIIQKLFTERAFRIQVHYFFLFHPYFEAMNPSHKGENLSLRFEYNPKTFFSEFSALMKEYPKLRSLSFNKDLDCGAFKSVLRNAGQIEELNFERVYHAGPLCLSVGCQQIQPLTQLQTLKLGSDYLDPLTLNLLTGTPNLISLDIQAKSLFKNDNVIPLPQLEKLTITSTYFPLTDLLGVLKLTSRLNHLELLGIRIKDGDFSNLLAKTNLTRLNFNCVTVSTFELTQLFSGTHYLTHLTLSAIHSLENSSFDISLTSLKRLSKLKLQNLQFSDLSEIGLQQALEQLTQLRSLSLISPKQAPQSNLTGSCLDLNNPRALGRLKNLRVERFPNFKLQGLLNTFKRNPKPLLLEKLKLKEILNLQDRDLAPLLAHTTALTYLNLSVNVHITVDAFDPPSVLQGLKRVVIDMDHYASMPRLFANATQLVSLAFQNTSSCLGQPLPPLSPLTSLRHLQWSSLPMGVWGKEIVQLLLFAPYLQSLGLEARDCLEAYEKVKNKAQFLHLLDENTINKLRHHGTKLAGGKRFLL